MPILGGEGCGFDQADYASLSRLVRTHIAGHPNRDDGTGFQD